MPSIGYKQLKPLVESARLGGAAAAEVLASSWAGNQVVSAGTRIGPVTRTSGQSLAVRVWMEDGRSGSASGSLSQGGALVDRAVAKAESATPSEFSGPVQRMRVAPGGLSTADQRWEQIGDDDRIDVVNSNERSVSSGHPSIHSTRFTYEDRETFRAFVNTRGVELEERTTWYKATGAVQAETEQGTLHLQQTHHARNFASTVCLPFGRNLTDEMERLLGPLAESPGAIRVHLPSLAIGPIFARLGPLFTPEKMTEKCCLMAGGPLHRKVHLVDDGVRPGALRTRLFDDRGVHAVPLTLIKDGVVDRVFLDPPTARAQGTRPTGHSRDGQLCPTNLLIRPGTRTANAILTELGQTVFEVGIFPEDFKFNSSTGKFSATVSGRIRTGGKYQGTLRNVSLAGNLVEALKSVFDVTSNTDRIGHVDAPGFIVDGLTVT